MVVKQIYAGWVGVVAGSKVHSGSVEFELTPDRAAQLVPYTPTTAESTDLNRRIRESKLHGHEPYTSQLGGQYARAN